MADCYWHGYSGGPGRCPDCEREDAEGKERGSIPYYPEEHLTMKELEVKRLNESRPRGARRLTLNDVFPQHGHK
jgi:hypothetical protein